MKWNLHKFLFRNNNITLQTTILIKLFVILKSCILNKFLKRKTKYFEVIKGLIFQAKLTSGTSCDFNQGCIFSREIFQLDGDRILRCMNVDI